MAGFIRAKIESQIEQFFKLVFMSSDSIHDAVMCAKRTGRTLAID
jgi:hypothetical protein